HGRPDSGDAFLPDPGSGPARVKDDLAEELAEEFLTSATSAEESLPEALEGEVPEEAGGPFVPSSAKQEVARGNHGSNPRCARTEERLPSGHGGPERKALERKRWSSLSGGGPYVGRIAPTWATPRDICRSTWTATSSTSRSPPGAWRASIWAGWWGPAGSRAP